MNEGFRNIVCFLVVLFRQIVCYLAKLFHQIAFPKGQTIYVGHCFGHDDIDGENEYVSEVNIIVSKDNKAHPQKIEFRSYRLNNKMSLLTIVLKRSIFFFK